MLILELSLTAVLKFGTVKLFNICTYKNTSKKYQHCHLLELRVGNVTHTHSCNTPITIIEHKELKRAVSARELHQFLEINTDFTDWCKRMLEYGFEKNLDFVIFLIFEENSEKGRGRPSKDYFLTIECAKEISMLQRTEKGKEARRYFIE